MNLSYKKVDSNVNEKNITSDNISIDPYTPLFVRNFSNRLDTISSPLNTKEQRVVSFLHTNDFITAFVNISKNISQVDISNVIYNKTYDDLGLDHAIAYRIKYIELLQHDEQTRKFFVFVIDPQIITNIFKRLTQKVHYIDSIIPLPLLFEPLFTKNIIKNSVTCFIYFGQNDASVTIYNNKKFVYAKSMDYSFLQMHRRFCTIHEKNVTYENFLDFFLHEDLHKTQSPYREDALRLYKEIFSHINDILTYIQRVLKIDKIETVYIDTQFKSAARFNAIAQSELNIKSSSFDFDYGLNKTQKNIDPLHPLMHLYQIFDFKERYRCNFTLYKRPLKWTKRASGRVALFTAASLAVLSLYPLSCKALAYTYSLEYKVLKEKYKALHSVQNTRESALKKKEKQKRETLKLLAKNKKEYLRKKETLLTIHKAKSSYLMKAKLLNSLTRDLNRYKIELRSIQYTQIPTKVSMQKELRLSLFSLNDNKITDLLQYLTKQYEKKLHFALEEISYEKEEKIYQGKLKIELL